MKQFEKLTPEQSERLMDCKTPEDILAFAQSEGYEVHRFPQPGVPGAINCRCMGCGAAFVTIGGVLHT